MISMDYNSNVKEKKKLVVNEEGSCKDKELMLNSVVDLISCLTYEILHKH